MSTLQELFEALLHERYSYSRLGGQIIAERFLEAGISLTAKQRSDLERDLEEIRDGGEAISIELSDDQIAQSSLTAEQLSSRSLSLDLDHSPTLARLEESIPEVIDSIVKQFSPALLNALKGDMPSVLKEKKAIRSEFEKRLDGCWGEALDLLEAVREIALHAGNEINEDFRQEATSIDDYVLDALTRLQARGCQVASEVLTLLRAGFADGAHARWRLLHEIAVIGFFLKSHGNDLAERYVLHESIATYKALPFYNKYQQALGLEEIPEEERKKVSGAYDNLRARYGSDYCNRYGWASEALRKRKPTFEDIEKDVGLDHLRPYYKLACYNVHADPKSAFFRLGLLPDQDALLAGPSDLGLADPCHGAAISLEQITVALLTCRPNLERLVCCEVLSMLQREIGTACLLAHRSSSDAADSSCI